MKRILKTTFFLLLTLLNSQIFYGKTKANTILIIQQSKRLSPLSRYIYNDLNYVFKGKKKIKIRFNPSFNDKRFSNRLKQKLSYETFLIYSRKNRVFIRYINTYKNINRLFSFSSKKDLRKISVNTLQKIYKITIPLKKKSITIFQFKNLSRYKTHNFVGEMLAASLGHSLQKGKKIKVYYAYLNKKLLKRFKISKKASDNEKVLRVNKIYGADAAVIGNYIVLRNRIRVNIYIIENKKKVFLIQKNLPLKKSFFYIIDNLALKVRKEIEKRYPLSPPKIVYVPKIIEKLKEQPTKYVYLTDPISPPPPKKTEKKVEKKPKKTVLKKKAEKNKIKTQIYSKAGTVELGGIIFANFNAFKSSEDFSKELESRFFVSVFPINYFHLGFKLDAIYNFENKTFNKEIFFLTGTAFPLSSYSYLSLNLKLGYSDQALKNYYIYANEIILKFKLAEHLLLGIGAEYRFYKEDSTENSNFYDRGKSFIEISGYF